jgi:RNA recognition motif-containing protein
LQADSGNEKDNTNTSRDKRSRDGDSLDHNGLKKASVLLPSFSQEAAGVNAGSFFFGNKGQQRPDSSFAQSSNQKNFSEDSKVIYMGGIPEGANEGVIRELLGIHGLLNDVISVKINTGKPFAFVEFRSHAAAKTLFELGEGGLIIGNRRINIGWGKGKPRAEQDSTSAYRRPSHATVLQPPSDDAKTLFVGGIPANTTSEQIKSLFPHPERVQAVNMPEGKNFAFVELATHDDALISIQSAQSSSGEDGGSPCFFLDGVPLGLGWAKGRSKDDLGFGSKHDTHKMDCWFCLASPTAKVQCLLIHHHIKLSSLLLLLLQLHLVVSVSDHMYLALPRGGLSPYHVLVVPIECVPSRIHLSQCKSISLTYSLLSTLLLFLWLYM